MSPVSSTRNGAVERLRAGDAEGALQWLLAAGTAPGVPSPIGTRERPAVLRRLFGLSRGAPARVGADLLQARGFDAALRAARPEGYADYLYHRFANPSFLAALPPLVVLGDALRHGGRRRLLELMSGVGHSSATVSALCPGVEPVMADVDFVNLYVARRYVAPAGAALCVDVELPLPLRDDSIDGVYCLDGLHYARSKVALLREVDRIVGPEGAWLFAHMHNARGANVNPGAPLDPGGYAKRFAFGQQRLLAETGILRQFQRDGALDLAQQPASADLDSSDALTLFGARTEDLWRRYVELDAALSRRPDLLEFNPLYRLDRTPDGVVASAQWPSESLRRECEGTPPLLRESVRVSRDTLRQIASAKAGGPLPGAARELLRSFALVPLPECYPRIAADAVV
jgi:SAM-dependent methyltransferase